MSKQLVVHDTTTNTLEALDPASATALALPAVRVGNSLPKAGQVVGEGYMVAPTKMLYFWDGTRWVPAVPATLLTYPTDAALLADKGQSAGSYALATSTGNLYSVKADGSWRMIGLRVYATQAAMTADTTAVLGDLAFATDTKIHFSYDGTTWVRLGGPVITLGTTPPATGYASGDFFYDIAKKLLSVRGATTWDLVGGGGCKVAATAPTAPNVGDMWLDTTGKDLKTWDGTAWVLPYAGFTRNSDGVFQIDSTANTGELRVVNGGTAKDFGFKSRAGDGPIGWVSDHGAYHNFMEVDHTGKVTFPNTSMPRLAGYKSISHHVYASAVWEETTCLIVGIENYVPVGHFYKIEVDLRGQKFHDGKLYMQTKWLGVGSADGYLRIEAGVEEPTMIGVTRTLTGVCAAGNIEFHVLTYGEGGGNGDRMVTGNLLLWDLGPPANVPAIA